MFLLLSLTINEIQDLLLELDKDDDNCIRIALSAPVERPEADTDCYSDKSDEVTCDAAHLPHRILAAEVLSCYEEVTDNTDSVPHSETPPSVSDVRQKA